MGAFVLESLTDSKLLIGSFSGMYVWDRVKQLGLDLQGKPLPSGRRGRIKPGTMAAGAAVKGGQTQFWVEYRKGIQLMDQSGIKAFPMPQSIEKAGMSLWHFLFECHNGRIFRGIFGQYTWLFITLGGIILMISVLTGCYDWLFRKVLAPRSRRKNEGAKV